MPLTLKLSSHAAVPSKLKKKQIQSRELQSCETAGLIIASHFPSPHATSENTYANAFSCKGRSERRDTTQLFDPAPSLTAGKGIDGWFHMLIEKSASSFSAEKTLQLFGEREMLHPVVLRGHSKGNTRLIPLTTYKITSANKMWEIFYWSREEMEKWNKWNEENKKQHWNHLHCSNL